MTNVDLKLGQRRGRWPSFKSTWVHCLELAGDIVVTLSVTGVVGGGHELCDVTNRCIASKDGTLSQCWFNVGPALDLRSLFYIGRCSSPHTVYYTGYYLCGSCTRRTNCSTPVPQQSNKTLLISTNDYTSILLQGDFEKSPESPPRSLRDYRSGQNGFKKYFETQVKQVGNTLPFQYGNRL